MEATFDLLRFGASSFLVAAGLALVFGGVLGVLRFPDIYTRLHAAGTETLGAALVLGGLAAAAGAGDAGARLLLLAALVAWMGPIRSQLIANAAHCGGLAPLAGPYRAPRPGARQAGAP